MFARILFRTIFAIAACTAGLAFGTALAILILSNFSA